MHFRVTQKVVTAKAGAGGPVVYLTEDDDWTHDLHMAEFINDEAHAQLRLLSSPKRRAVATGLRLADVCNGPNGPVLASAP